MNDQDTGFWKRIARYFVAGVFAILPLVITIAAITWFLSVLVGFVAFHLLFWRLFDWKQDLASLSFVNRQVMQILNLCLTFVFLIFAYVSWFHADELLGTGLGQALLVLISLFWFLRAIEQVVFFGLRNGVSVAFFLTFLVGSALYAYPWLLARGIV